MNRRFVLIFIVSLFIFSLSAALEVQQAKAYDTIYIRADGSVDPTWAPIQHVGDAYALTGNITGSLVIERSNIVLDGKGFTIDGGGRGVNVTDVNNVTVSDVNVRACDYGIWFYSSSNSSILNNAVTECVWMGITVYYSTGCTVFGNNVTNNYSNVWVANSSHTTVSNNTLAGSQSYGASALYIDHESYENDFCSNTFRLNYNDVYLAPYSHNNTLSGNSFQNGIDINESPNNVFIHNNFVFRSQVSNYYNCSNTWDNGFEGNFWNDYDGTDSNNNGIGDSPCLIGVNNTDYYPLMGMFHSFNTSLGYNVNVISNSTVEDFEYSKSSGTITMHVSNMTETQTFGFCRICVPHALMSEPYNVTIDGAEPIFWNYTLYDNGTYRWIYFSYQHSTLEIVITPEFPPFLVLTLFMITTLLAAMTYRRKRITLSKR